ncbi:hypothetical protein CK516_17900 [Nostoc sp. 'Peltigera malacea cyanobiont' DB3992]|nr:hypothetical protein CK516_17900 [Nostoc sp. 'Peltigera malacea cyanobiont' DB3992]
MFAVLKQKFGLGDDAQALASLGFEVTAFDISPTAMSDDKLLLFSTRGCANETLLTFASAFGGNTFKPQIQI